MKAICAPPAAEPAAAGISLAYRLEAWGAALAFAVFRCLPLDRASAIGGALARRIGPALGISKRARLNLRAALPELPAAEIDAILRRMWDNLGRVAAEYPHLREIRVFAPGGRVETRGFEHVDRALAAGRRMIIFSGHLANWEIAALAAGQYGIDVAQIYRAANIVVRSPVVFPLETDGGVIELGDEQFALSYQWAERGQLALYEP